MNVSATELAGVVAIEPVLHADDRGWFFEACTVPRLDAALRSLGLPETGGLVQINQSSSRAGVLRGLHFQTAPRAQGKLVWVVRGAAWDVAVDVRPGSPNFGRWVGLDLSAANRRQVWIPPGFAHGFLALEDDTHCMYMTTDLYAKEYERVLRWDDPALGIVWPLPAGTLPRLSPRDAAAPLLASIDLGTA